jgi:CheY-like chemotaxis protein
MNESAIILLAEDLENDVFLIRRAFQRAGFTNLINVVRDGEEAIDYLSGTSAYANRDEYPLPDLILLDLKMPKVGGFEVLKWLRRQPEIGRTPVVVLTTSDEINDVNKAYELGANSFFVKPSDFENYANLAAVIREYWLKWVNLPQPFRLVPEKQGT